MGLLRLPRRQRVRTSAGSLEYVLSGRQAPQAPTLVLLNGAGVTLDGWARLYPDIEAIGRVLACNRFGVGASSPPGPPQTGSMVVAGLREALAALQLAPPYLLVGHSLGGLHAQLFARLHPQEVAGALLIEATHPGDREQLKGHEGRLASVLGRLLRVPQQLFRANLHAELDWIDATAREVEAAGPFPPVPLVVLTGGNAPPAWLQDAEGLRRRRARQQALAALSPLGTQVIARRSGHFPQLTQPALVVEELRRLAQAVAPSGGDGVAAAGDGRRQHRA